MTVVYDMAAGSIRSDARDKGRDETPLDRHPEILPNHPAPALREFEATEQPELNTIHLVRELLKQG